MNLWQSWLQAFTQSQQTAANNLVGWNSQLNKQFTSQYAQQWQQACKQWQQGMEGAWSTPASFWQTVSSIQSARARWIAEFCQQQPEYLAQLFQCTSYSQLIECLTRWQGHNLTTLTNLAVITQAQRGNLMSEWKHQMPFLSTSPAALAKMWNAGNFWNNSAATSAFINFGNMAKPQSSQASQAQATPVSKPTQPAAASHSSMSPVQSSAPAQASQVSVPAPAPVAAPVAPSTQSTSQLNLLNTPNGQATISSTADSVMRSSNGSTIAAAAAARRSVVARRVANNRRRASR